MRSSIALMMCLLPASLALTQGPMIPASNSGGRSEPAALSAPPPALPIEVVSRLPTCKAQDLLVSTDGEEGNFNGMSHGGVLIIIRNNGTGVCKLLPLAQATLLDKDGKVLGPFSAKPPGAIGMHPGPVVLPIAVAVGAEVTATMRWISGQVYTDSVCLQPTTLALEMGGVTVKTPMGGGQLCGERGKDVEAELSRFAPDDIAVAARAR